MLILNRKRFLFFFFDANKNTKMAEAELRSGMEEYVFEANILKSPLFCEKEVGLCILGTHSQWSSISRRCILNALGH